MTYALMSEGAWRELPIGEDIVNDDIITSYASMISWSSQYRTAQGIKAIQEPEIPAGKIVVSSSIVDQDGKPLRVNVLADEPEPEPVEPAPARTYKADVWRRCTDAQADMIDTELTKLGTRQRRLWDDAQYLDHADPLVVMLKAQMTAAFGESEAARILAPSE